MQISNVAEKAMSIVKTLRAAIAPFVVFGACSVGWAAIGLAADSDTEPMSESSRQEKASQIFAFLAGATQDSSPRRIQNYLKSSELVDALEFSAADLYGEDDPNMIPWLYLAAMDSYRLAGILASDDNRVSYHAVRQMANQSGGKKLNAFSLGGNVSWADPGTASSLRQLHKSFLVKAMSKFSEMAEIFESAGNPEAQAMAWIYRADMQLLRNWGTPFANYREAQELLRQAGIAEDRIELFFGRPQLITVNRFYTTLEAAIENQEAELALRMQTNDPARQAPYFAWDTSVPAVRSPLPIDSLAAARESYEYVDLRFRITAEGDVRAVNVYASGDSGAERNARIAREAAYKLDFRPALVDGRGQPQSGLHMRFHLPSGVK